MYLEMAYRLHQARIRRVWTNRDSELGRKYHISLIEYRKGYGDFDIETDWALLRR
jgi:hypothetical protein